MANLRKAIKNWLFPEDEPEVKKVKDQLMSGYNALVNKLNVPSTKETKDTLKAVEDKFEAFARQLAEETVSRDKEYKSALEKVEDKLKETKKAIAPSTEEKLVSVLERLVPGQSDNS